MWREWPQLIVRQSPLSLHIAPLRCWPEPFLLGPRRLSVGILSHIAPPSSPGCSVIACRLFYCLSRIGAAQSCVLKIVDSSKTHSFWEETPLHGGLIFGVRLFLHLIEIAWGGRRVSKWHIHQLWEIPKAQQSCYCGALPGLISVSEGVISMVLCATQT